MTRSHPILVLAALLSGGCLQSSASSSPDAGAPAVDAGADPGSNPTNADAIPYRALDGHPGCTIDGLASRSTEPYTPAQIPGYKCAAKDYGTAKEDVTKPIVLLVHGNSSTPADYETFSGDANATPMLSERLVAQGYRVLAVDFRFDKTDDPTGDNKTQNAAHNFDHGWAEPILEHFIASVMTAFPQRSISLVAFSLGPTIARDALRRLHRAGMKPFERIDSLVYASGGNHGVSTYRTLCDSNPTMRGRVACELGDRTSFTPTTFLTPLNGPNGAYETPCADGETAFGQTGVCGHHAVKYTTVVMRDISQGTYQDEFVSQESAMLQGANNLTVDLSDTDPTGYFYNGLFKSHYGAIRSEAGLKIVLTALGATP